MNVTTLILIRHGQTEWNVAQRYQGQGDSPLTELGRQQAERIAARLEAYRPDLVISSDLQRAVDTAKTIVNRISVPHFTDTAWRERHFGAFEGAAVADVEATHGPEIRIRMATEPDYAEHGIESLAQLSSRVQNAMDRIASEHSGKTVVVVTHGGNTLAAARLTLGIPIGAPRRLSIANCALNVFSHRDGNWFVEIWGAQA